MSYYHQALANSTVIEATFDHLNRTVSQYELQGIANLLPQL